MTPEMFRKLAALGLSHEQMAGVLEIVAEEGEARKAKARARVQKWRENHKDETLRNVTERHSASRNVTPVLARVEDSSSISEIKEIKEGKKESRAPAAPTPRSELAKVLDGELVEAVIEHRKGFKGKFSTRAAHLLAIEFAKCPDPNAGADEMIRRNWQGFKAEWMDNIRGHSPPPNGTSRPKSGMMDVIAEMLSDDDDRQRQSEDQGDWSTVHPRSLPAPRAGRN